MTFEPGATAARCANGTAHASLHPPSRGNTVKPATAGSSHDVRSRSRITGLAGDLAAGMVSMLVMLCYAMSLGTMIFSADLARYAGLGVPTAFISCVVTALVIALTSSMRANIAGPDGNATAFLAGVAAGVASSVRADGGAPRRSC